MARVGVGGLFWSVFPGGRGPGEGSEMWGESVPEGLVSVFRVWLSR